MMAKPPSSRKKSTSAASTDGTAPDNVTKKEIPQEENPATATITVTAIEVPELTEQEQSDRLDLERHMERAVFEAGKALMKLRDRIGQVCSNSLE
jgi:ATP-dependent Clp protease ATP-binding subunit ClpA